MKKGLLAFILCFVCLVKANANDTLTRAEVYNFNAGDTFDYYAYDYASNGMQTQTSTSFSRYVITNTYYTANADSLVVIRRKEYPLPHAYDTSVYIDLQSYEYFYLNGFTTSDSLYIDTNSIYHGRNVNGIIKDYISGDEVAQVAEGLGLINEEFHSSNSTDHLYEDHIYRLIYYSKGTENWGTPYYFNIISIEAVSNETFSHISPNPTTLHLTIQLQQTPSCSTTFRLFDLTGRLILQQPLTEKETQIELSGVSKGMYLYQVTSDEQQIASGKLVVE